MIPKPVVKLRIGTVSSACVIYLTAAFAFWLVVLADLRSEPRAVVILWVSAIAAGWCAHLLYNYLLAWRGTMVTSTILLSVAIFATTAVLFRAGDDVLRLLSFPIELVVWQRWPERLRTAIPVFKCMFFFATVHAVKPCIVNAFITAPGISLGYGIAVLIAAHAR